MFRLEGSAKSALAAGLAATAAVALAVSPAAATIRSGAINCTANITELPGVSVALTQPQVTHVSGPAWVAQGSAFAIKIVGGTTELPSGANALPISQFSNVISKAQIVGDATTTVSVAAPILSGGFANDGSYYYDDDIGDANPPVKMDGLLGHPVAPTVTVAAITLPAPVPGTYVVTTNLTPSGALNVVPDTSGGLGGRIYAPDITVAVTNAGTVDGPISYVGRSTTLTALVAGALHAVTSCAPSAAPEYTAQVQTDGDPAVASAPVVACQPSGPVTGSLSDSKGWWSDDSSVPAAQFGGSIKGDATYDGCVVPDQKVDAWQAAKTGAPAANALAVNTAAIKIKGKHYGNCTEVGVLTGEGLNSAANSPLAYPFYGSIQAKFNDTKVKGPQAAVGGAVVVDLTPSNGVARAYFEAQGTVSKGTGVGGSLYFLAQLDATDVDVQGIIACNSPGYTPPGTGVFYGKNGLPMTSSADNILSVTLP